MMVKEAYKQSKQKEEEHSDMEPIFEVEEAAPGYIITTTSAMIWDIS